MWFTETPWPPIFLFGIIAAVLMAVWSVRKTALPLIGAAVLGVLSVLTFVFERWYVTDAEQVEQSIDGVARAFQQQDREKTLSYFSPQADKTRTMVRAALELVEVKQDLDIKDISVRMVAAGSQAISRFRANASVAIRGGADLGWQPSRFEVTWQREAGDWKIVKIVRLHPFKEEVLGLLDATN